MVTRWRPFRLVEYGPVGATDVSVFMGNDSTGFWGTLRRPFVLDLRALALLRITTAAVLLTDLAIRSTDLEAHYANMGVMPMGALLEHGWTPYQFSLHAASGMWQFEALLFVLAAGLAGALLLGCHTRLVTVASTV